MTSFDVICVFVAPKSAVEDDEIFLFLKGISVDSMLETQSKI